MLENIELKKNKHLYGIIVFILGWMLYSEFTGWNVFSTDSSEKWSAAGHQNYHK